MNVETQTKAPAIDAPLAPNNLPAVAEPVKQERKPRLPRTVPIKTDFSANVAKAVIMVSREIGKIQKDGENTFQRYKYTKWEDINERLSPLLVDHGLVVVQSEISRDILERSSEGCVLAITYHFTLVHESGESWPPVEWTSIARLTDKKGTPDDKAASKCHTQAEKGFCLKQFKIRTDDYIEGDGHETLSRQNPKAKEIYREMELEVDGCQSVVELAIWGKDNAERVKGLHPDWQAQLRARYHDQMEVLKKGNVVMDDEKVDQETGEVVG